MKKITIYVCGITPYDTTHLGHCFTYISFDALIRYLKFKGNKVVYAQNITDINDRDKDILERAKKQNTTWEKLSSFWTKKFLKDMKFLNWIYPDYLVKASEKIDEMIGLIQKLLNKNLAYQINNSVFLDISKFPDYGKLSKFSRKKMLRVAKDFEEDLENPDKKDPLDITLWKGAIKKQEKHIPVFSSPFGFGRPGWHIECSGMAISTLGEQIDIHGGGKDLIFPHHEAEIVQSQGATGKIPFAKKWMHTGTVYYKNSKMSKSKGNLVMVSDLLKKYSPNAIRWLILSNYWRKNWEFKEGDLKKAQKNVNQVESIISRNSSTGQFNIEQFKKIMDNDLNTPKVLQLLLKNPSREIYKVLGFKTKFSLNGNLPVVVHEF